MPLMITEALAEIKTIGKRMDSKRAFIMGFLARQDGVKDPLEKDGGSVVVIARERQAIGDLEKRIIALRRGIQKANDSTSVTINGVTRSIADWLTWRRDVAPKAKDFTNKLRGSLTSIRENAKKQGIAVIQPGATASQPADFVINVDEAALAKEIETMEDTLGQLDGQLSLKNATVAIQEDAA